MAVVTKKSVEVEAVEPGTRKTKGGGSVETPAVPAYKYDEVSVVSIEGDTTGKDTFASAFSELVGNDFKAAIKYLVKGYNFYAKKNAKPGTNSKVIAAQRVLAESLGMSLADFQALISNKS